MSSPHEGDSVTGNQQRELLVYLNDRKEDVFFIATANNIHLLPYELTRAGRFDAVFFVDLPKPEERDAIWRIHLKNFDMSFDLPRPDDDKWTGAEIASCVRLAALLGISLIEAGKKIVPVAVSGEASVNAVRDKADNNWLDARTGEVFRKNAVPTAAAQRPRRRSLSRPTAK